MEDDKIYFGWLMDAFIKKRTNYLKKENNFQIKK
jgi:hypothetical protein